MSQIILVPIDFTPTTEGALKQSIYLSKQIGTSSLLLLHMCKRQKDVEDAIQRLEKLAEGYRKDVDILCKAIEGGIEDIGKTAQVLGASLICMGTHGLKGIQYLIGSKAIKVVSGTSLPFIITQEVEPTHKTWREIIVPLDFAAEEKRVLSEAAALAKTLKGRLHLIGAGHDDELLSKKVDNNLHFAQRFLKEKKVDFLIEKANSKQSFQEAILEYSKVNNGDIIAIVNHHEDGVRNLLGANFDQNIITNEFKVPVLMFTGKALDDKRDIFGMFR